MSLQPSKEIPPAQVESGLKLVTLDGVTSEIMVSLTTGTFLVAMALLLGASNLQIGILAASPTFNNLFQLLSIWLVRRYNNRRAICVYCQLAGRTFMLFVGILLIASKPELNWVILFLFFYYFFASIASPSWNAWMKDLVPESRLGSFFARRSAFTQATNAIMSLSAALLLDYVRKHHPSLELTIYGSMFVLGSVSGLIGCYVLAKTPEPLSYLSRENLFQLFRKPLSDPNFIRLLSFNSLWVFAVNLATPFFSVFMLKAIGLPLSYIILLTIASQLSGVFFVRRWGAFADRYSNKSILAITIPVYLVCLIGWSFGGIYTSLWANLLLLFWIHVLSGISLAGINLSLVNIGMKLAPKEYAIVYLSVRNIMTAGFSALAPIIGGLLADYFSDRHLLVNAEWVGPVREKTFHLVALNEWNFLFLISAVFVFIASQLLTQVKEAGEVEHREVRKILRKQLRHELKEYFLVGGIIQLHDYFRERIRRRTV
ncbi:MFS transporter [Flavihumibacter petaseus]|uniref:Putative major facilitator superfamily transporter n=1 Tax=Flavihumibacter petaseus NBRC 106054 TaxID=1220578 RepID=A0A0E9MVY5_9BACT|nr:MFS transporter [Flavihumibacter petaseus]GAO41581.1 putative major facilitator superfamily transporter [Flavihumibacter petaseus NBRC 106054]